MCPAPGTTTFTADAEWARASMAVRDPGSFSPATSNTGISNAANRAAIRSGATFRAITPPQNSHQTVGRVLEETPTHRLRHFRSHTGFRPPDKALSRRLQSAHFDFVRKRLRASRQAAGVIWASGVRNQHESANAFRMDQGKVQSHGRPHGKAAYHPGRLHSLGVDQVCEVRNQKVHGVGFRIARRRTPSMPP